MGRLDNAETYARASLGAALGAAKYYRPSPSALAWGALAAGVVAYELKASEGQLMSEGADRLLEKHPILPRFIGAIILGHVVNAYPERYDPIHWGLRFLKGL